MIYFKIEGKRGMKIALINENSQKKRNAFILEILEKVAKKYGHEVFNYGVSLDKDYDLDYVGAGVLTAILLNSKAVDLVITGCASGQGVMMVANTFPNVYCGLINDVTDVTLFQKINGGNAISIPFGKKFGIGMEIELEAILEGLFKTTPCLGYPKERQDIQNAQREKFHHLKTNLYEDFATIIEEMDKDVLYAIIHNEYFAENFFLHSKNDRVSSLLRDLFDAWV